MRGLLAEEKVDAAAWKKNGFLYKITKYLEKVFFFYADITIVLTDSSKEFVSKNSHPSHKRIEIMPTCVDTNSFLPTGLDLGKQRLGLNGKFVIVYLGSLGTFYALDEMADFFSVVLKNNYVNNPYFLIITNNPSNVIYQSLQLRNIPKDSYDVRQMTRAQLKDALPVADVSLMFYRRILSGAGCCPTKFGESLACGLPIIINTGIGDTESIVNNEKIGVVVKEFSQESYKNAIEQLMQLLSERNALRQRCRLASIKHFSLDKAIDKYSKIYQRLAKI